FRRLLIAWQQTAALQVNEVGRHHDEFAGQFDVQFFEGLKIFEVLAGDALERNVVDVDLVLFDQIQQQVERPFKDLQLNFVIGVHLSAGDFTGKHAPK